DLMEASCSSRCVGSIRTPTMKGSPSLPRGTIRVLTDESHALSFLGQAGVAHAWLLGVLFLLAFVFFALRFAASCDAALLVPVMRARLQLVLPTLVAVEMGDLLRV